MGKRIFSRSLSIYLMFMVFILLFPIGTITQSLLMEKSNNFQKQTISTVAILDFSDFIMLNNDQYMTTINSGSELTIAYVGDKDQSTINESVYLDLSQYGGILDFDFEIKIEYMYDGWIFGDIDVILGSHYWENGTLSGTPKDNLGKPICSSFYIDNWLSDCSYGLAAFPNDTMENVNTSSIGGNIGYAKFQMKRTNGVINSKLIMGYDVNVTELDEYWFNDVSKPLYYLSLRLTAIPEISDSVSVTFSKLLLSFNFDSNSTTSPEGVQIGFSFIKVINFISIAFVVMFVRKNRRF